MGSSHEEYLCKVPYKAEPGGPRQSITIRCSLPVELGKHQNQTASSPVTSCVRVILEEPKPSSEVGIEIERRLN